MNRPISNKRARRIALHLAGLTQNPERPFGPTRLLETIDHLGFVQVDSISAVARAHHHILFARAHNYHPDQLRRALEKDRTLFEDWAHDAAVIPISYRPYWATRFKRHADRVSRTPRWQERLGKDKGKILKQIEAHIHEHGPTSTKDLQAQNKAAAPKGNGWWDWKPEKAALDYLWRTGVLSVSHRNGFSKVYDLSERIIPDPHLETYGKDQCLEWAAAEALKRLGFATPAQISHFFLTVSNKEATEWARQNAQLVTVTGADGTKKEFFGDANALAAAPKTPPLTARILSPFDPLIHDRARAKFLFGFDYTIEVFVPAAKRKYGYFTCPILIGDELVGRVDLKAHRTHATPHLAVNGLWFEEGHDSKETRTKVDEALHRLEPFSLIAL